MLLYGRTQMLPQYSYEEAIAFLLDAGFDGVEISAFDKSFTLREEFFAPGFGQRMRALLEQRGARGFSVSAHCDYTADAQNLEIVRRALCVAAEMGSPCLIINGAVCKAALPFASQWDAMIETTRGLARLAEERRVQLAIEYEPGFVIDSTELLLRALRQIDSPAVGINCDLGHVFLCDPDPLQAVAQSAPWIRHGHVENMARGVHNHLLPWEGDMDLAAFLAALRANGFDGALALDLYQYEYADVCARCAEFLRPLMADQGAPL